MVSFNDSVFFAQDWCEKSQGFRSVSCHLTLQCKIQGETFTLPDKKSTNLMVISHQVTFTACSMGLNSPTNNSTNQFICCTLTNIPLRALYSSPNEMYTLTDLHCTKCNGTKKLIPEALFTVKSQFCTGQTVCV